MCRWRNTQINIADRPKARMKEPLGLLFRKQQSSLPLKGLSNCSDPRWNVGFINGETGSSCVLPSALQDGHCGRTRALQHPGTDAHSSVQVCGRTRALQHPYHLVSMREHLIRLSDTTHETPVTTDQTPERESLQQQRRERHRGHRDRFRYMLQLYL